MLMKKISVMLEKSAIKNGPKEKTFLGNQPMPEDLKKLLIGISDKK